MPGCKLIGKCTLDNNVSVISWTVCFCVFKCVICTESWTTA